MLNALGRRLRNIRQPNRIEKEIHVRSRLTFAAVVLLTVTTFSGNWEAAGAADEASSRACSARERTEALRKEQERVLALVGEHSTLEGPGDLARLAQRNPYSEPVYNFYPHQYASINGMGFALFNTGKKGVGRPDLLLYAPAPAKDVTDPYGPDFPYTLAGWGYLRDYDPKQHPKDEDVDEDTDVPQCLVREDWFVHERSIHPADSWQNAPAPPDEHGHGQAFGNEPIQPTDCTPSPCPAGVPHPRFWDTHQIGRAHV